MSTSWCFPYTFASYVGSQACFPITNMSTVCSSKNTSIYVCACFKFCVCKAKQIFRSLQNINIVVIILLPALYISVPSLHFLCCVQQFLAYRSTKYKVSLALCTCIAYSNCKWNIFWGYRLYGLLSCLNIFSVHQNLLVRLPLLLLPNLFLKIDLA